MKAIRTTADASAVAEMFVTENPNMNRWYCPGYDADKPFIQMWDNSHFNQIMIFGERDEGGVFYKVWFLDTVNDKESYRWMNFYEIVRHIWTNRKFINQSGQLADL